MNVEQTLNRDWRRWIECQVSRDNPTALPLQQMLYTLCTNLYSEDTLASFARRGILIWPRCTPGSNLDGLPDDAKALSFYTAGVGLKEYEKKRLEDELKKRGIQSLENFPIGPEQFSFTFAGGQLYAGWIFHHIYDGTSALGKGKKTLNARHHGLHFTQTAGMVAIHPIVEALYDYFPCIKRTLRARSFKEFGYDPDRYFSKCEHDDRGFEIRDPLNEDDGVDALGDEPDLPPARRTLQERMAEYLAVRRPAPTFGH
jgi:hypothetical protein